jgi:hypothetical protein
MIARFRYHLSSLTQLLWSMLALCNLLLQLYIYIYSRNPWCLGSEKKDPFFIFNLFFSKQSKSQKINNNRISTFHLFQAKFNHIEVTDFEKNENYASIFVNRGISMVNASMVTLTSFLIPRVLLYLLLQIIFPSGAHIFWDTSAIYTS